MKDKKYVLAIDQSTQGTKAIIFDRNGEIVCRCDLSHAQIINDMGWVSHDLNEIYNNTIQVCKNVIEKAQIDKEEIACLGISNQRETSAAWSKTTGLPLADAIVWQCARAESICERIRNSANDVAETIRKKTGMTLSPYFSASKFAWLQENVDEVKKAKDSDDLCFGTIDAYLIYRLTNKMVYATDYSNASRTQLFNINSLCWDQEICSMFNISLDSLPEVRNSSGQFGYTNLDGYFDEAIPICGVIGDSQGALFGQGCINKGMVKATYGTGSSVMMNVGEEMLLSNNGLVTSLAWGVDNKVSYVLEGNINYTGAVITWLKDEMKLIESPEETEELAYKANANDTTYLVPAFTGLGAPYWVSDAKAIIYGMTRTTGKNEVVKAALDSIVYQITDIIELMKAEDGIIVKELCVDGGPTKNKYLMQYQSDILETTVSLPRCQESSAQGAAYLAGISCGFYDINSLFIDKNSTHYNPSMSVDERINRYNGWKEAVNKVIK